MSTQMFNFNFSISTQDHEEAMVISRGIQMLGAFLRQANVAGAILNEARVATTDEVLTLDLDRGDCQ